jgi:hypothetical protein
MNPQNSKYTVSFEASFSIKYFEIKTMMYLTVCILFAFTIFGNCQVIDCKLSTVSDNSPNFKDEVSNYKTIVGLSYW